jgi:hypothetical protein
MKISSGRRIAQGTSFIQSVYDAEVRSIAMITDKNDLVGSEGYIFGCPTFHLDMPELFKDFLSMVQMADLEGNSWRRIRLSYPPQQGRGQTAALMFDMMESKYKMRMTNLVPFIWWSQQYDLFQPVIFSSALETPRNSSRCTSHNPKKIYFSYPLPLLGKG